MKKIYLVIMLTAVLSALPFCRLSAGEPQGGAVKRRNIVPGDNHIFAGVSLLGSNSSEYRLAFAGAEYGRRIKNNLFGGVSYLHGLYLGSVSKDCYGNCVNAGTGKNVATLSGMLYYYLPVCKKNVFLRGGLGAGLGYHYGGNSEYNNYQAENRLLPYITAELQWVIRLNCGLEFKLSPLLISPSRIMLALGDEYKGKTGRTCLYDVMHFSIGWNF